MRRVLRFDGLLPVVMDPDGEFRETTPDDIRQMKAFIDENRVLPAPIDIIMEGETPGEDREQANEIVHKWEDAGATWWIEALWNVDRDASGRRQVRQRLLQGPPGY